MVDLNRLKILNKNDISKGIAYSKGSIKPTRIIKYDDNEKIYHFKVISQRYNYYYDVEIDIKDNEVEYANCDCMQFYEYDSCKHIAACLYHYHNILFEEINPKKASLNVFNSLITSNNIKQQLVLDISLSINRNYYGLVLLDLKIGNQKMYNLNNKLSSFLDAYAGKINEVKFGKQLIYNNEQYYFNEEDKKIIEYLLIQKRNNYSAHEICKLSDEELKSFLQLIKNRTFTIYGFDLFNGILEGNPFKTNLIKKDNDYVLNFENNIINLTNDYEYVISDNVCYHVPLKMVKFLNLMKKNRIEELTFDEEQLDNFSKTVLPTIKENIKVSEELKDKIIIVNKPGVKIYIDFKYNSIVANVKLNYQDKEIDYFDNVKNILRDFTYEEEIVNDLISYGFIKEDVFIIKQVEEIGLFLDEYLKQLSNKYEVYTSEKINETKIKKNVNIKSSFSIGKDNIMSYQFDLSNIKNEELIDILDSLHKKKKYFRLKSGNFLNLEENGDLKQLDALIDDLELTNKDIANGYGIIPKYRAIYLDSLNYNIIQTDNLFSELINNIKNYKNIYLKIKDNILRDYKVISVKWIYNIYKCGFGGILADEMGLGKSIQLIYFLKQVLKEKDAKILIVSPTSLIYNWKAEFDKFGPELKYKVIAENKTKREHLLKEINDINILITTYGLVRQDLDKYLNINFEIVVIDEAQNIKNYNTQMSKAIKKINAITKIALTGTPLENSVLELWSIFDFIMPGYLASLNKFQSKYHLKDTNEEQLAKLDNLKKQIKPFILRRIKKNVILELPDKIENNIYIDMNDEQKKLYAAQVNKTNEEIKEIIAIEGFNKARFKILQLLTRLRQICIDPKIIYENYQGGSAKIEQLVSLTKEYISNDHKILLFSSYKMALDIVNLEFANNNISTYMIDGSVSSKKRMELVNKFNNDDTNVFLIMLKAGGTGLNLTSADVVIHLDLWWNPQVEMQATDRAHRIGQVNNVEVVKLICKGTIEERILELQNKKKILSDKLIDGDNLDENIISKLTEQDIKNLLLLDNE